MVFLTLSLACFFVLLNINVYQIQGIKKIMTLHAKW